jgi:hypothetical protein
VCWLAKVFVAIENVNVAILMKIKIDLKNNKSLKELADKYNVTVQCICLIKKEKNWKWVVVD